jgi:uncharacterized protein (TIGR00304 family)
MLLDDDMELVYLGVIIILIGFVLIFIGTFLQAKKGKTEAAAVAFIGPIPLIAGTSKEIVYVAIAITLILLVVFLWLNRNIFI